MGLLVVVFGFFFVTVSSRIVGIIGTSSNPVSGMTIATLMGTCLLFVALGWTGDAYQAVALCVGAMVCIAASNAGNTSQDLKTGYIVGATPRSQQLGLIIGVLGLGARGRLHHQADRQRAGRRPDRRRARHRLFGLSGAAGQPDGDHHPRPAGAGPAVGPGLRRHGDRGGDRAVRRQVAVVRGRALPAAVDHHADLHRRRAARA